MKRRLRRALDRADTRAPRDAPYASDWLRRFYTEQQHEARRKMREHDCLPPLVRRFDKVAGSIVVAQRLKAEGWRTEAEAEARVREMLERLPKPERHRR